MKLSARVLRVLLAAALLAPAPAFAQTRIVVPGAGTGAPAVVPSLGAGVSAPGLSAPALGASLPPSLSAPSLTPAPSAVPAALTPAIPAASSPEKPVVPVKVRGEREPILPVPGRLEQPGVPGTDALSALRDMPADIQSAPAAARRFDGSKEAARVPEEPIEPETVTREISDKTMPEDLAIWFTRKDRTTIKKNQTYALIRPVYGKPSQDYWEKFEKGKVITVKAGGQAMFQAPVTYAKTTTIDKLTRADFAGFYTPSMMRGKSLAKLRQKLIGDLNERNDKTTRGQSGVVTRLSMVRVVRVMTYSEAKNLPENKDEAVFEPAPRKQYELPAALQGLNHMTPKAVFLDMRLFKDGVPYPLIEDMTKLMKSGVYFILLSDKADGVAGSVEDQLTRGLTSKQKDMISRYKMVVLSDDGNALSSYDGQFARYLPSRRFSGSELELMRFAARQHGFDFQSSSHGTSFTVFSKKGNLAEADKTALLKTMSGLGLPADAWQASIVEVTGRAAVAVRPQNIVSAIPYLLEQLREHEGLYVNHSDIMTISNDGALLEALKGSVQPAKLMPLEGVDLADASIASILGPYRENVKGDLAASASKITSFKHDPDRIGGFSGGGNIYMMMGHVMHSAFNWAVWKYRNTGVFPSAEETIAEAEKIWKKEDLEREGPALDRPGENQAGFYEVMKGRLKTMHAVAADVLKAYPIAVGTELANMFVFENYKKNEFLNRDILRLIFDFVVARETPEGLEVVVVDFKTGQTPTLENLEKDDQVQLYDLIVRRMWPEISLPYGGTGEKRKVSDYKIRFIYPSAGYQPILNEWTRIKFERGLHNVMNRMRRHNAPPAPKAEAKPKKKRKPAKKA